MGFARRPGAPEALVSGAIARPGGVLAAWLLICAAATFGVGQLSIETSVDSVLDRSDPAWSFYRNAQQRFGDDEIIVILLEASEPYEPEVLEEVDRITSELENHPLIRRVDSLASTPSLHVHPEGMIDLRPYLESSQDLEHLARSVAEDRIASRYLVSDDGRAFAVNVLLREEAQDESAAVLDRIRETVGDRPAHVSGVPVSRKATNLRVRSELLGFLPATVVVVAAFLAFLFRASPVAAIPLLTSGMGSWLLFGVMGATGGAITVTTSVLSPVLLVVGVSYSMHLVSAVSSAQDSATRKERMLALAHPIALSGLTTTMGFIAISLVRIPALRDVGGYGALGVLAVLVASLTAGPALLSVLPVRARGKPPPLDALAGRVAQRVTSLVSNHRGTVIGGFALATLAAMAGIHRLNVESDVILWFSKDDPVRIDYEAIRDALSGISPMNVVIDAPEGSAISEPPYINALDGLTRHLEDLPEVGKAISIAAPLLELQEGFVGDGQGIESRAMVEQYLLLLDGAEFTGELVTRDRSSANVVLRLDHNGSEHLLSVAREAEAWWRRNGPAGSRAQTTGIMYEFARAENEIAWGQLRGLLFAVLTVSLILWLSLRSLTLAVIAIVPNMVPVAVVFGVMGWSGVPLDAGTALLGSLVLGIAVDDTVHVLHAFQVETRNSRSREDTCHAALTRVLPPVLATTVTIASGFVVLAFSGFLFIRHLGILTSGVLVLCLVADMLLLPALLTLKRSGGEAMVQQFEPQV